MANKKKYDDTVCQLLYYYGYSLQDIADIYTIVTKTPSTKSAISKILSKYKVTRFNKRIDPRKMKQEHINYIQKNGIFLPLVDMYIKKYTKPVRDTRFKKK